MGRYERMICYLYEYQDGHKGANVGYVKLEKRGEKCRVLIQMRRADLATLPQAALFQQEKTGVLLIPIGVMRDNNGSMKGQYEGNVDNLAGTGLISRRCTWSIGLGRRRTLFCINMEFGTDRCTAITLVAGGST